MKILNKVISFFSILLLLNGVSFADVFDKPVNLQTVSTIIPRPADIKCKFRQEKYLNNIAKPLISTGRFEYIQDKGVYFYTEYPFKSNADYSNKNYSQINEIINAISTARYSRLEKGFQFYFEGDSSKWSLGIKPKKNSDAYEYISSIEINGSENIDKICISQKNGNKTVIWFIK